VLLICYCVIEDHSGLLLQLQSAHATDTVKIEQSATPVNDLIAVLLGSPFTCQIPSGGEEAIMREAVAATHDLGSELFFGSW